MSQVFELEIQDRIAINKKKYLWYTLHNNRNCTEPTYKWMTQKVNKARDLIN